MAWKLYRWDPKNTSKMCSTCGFTHDKNRSGEEFKCLECGYENHADYNAAKNIGLKYVEDLLDDQNGGQGGAQNLPENGSVGVRLNSEVLGLDASNQPMLKPTALAVA